ncbi:uncharacterized protein VNE69_06003 [Vairimorpha necatrix]|uniref:Uncharacterized protein n=1 Tax=Vairimorpha necatrix TaxID=6039 RepID=A0AAX4JCE7_9MICR
MDVVKFAFTILFIKSGQYVSNQINLVLIKKIESGDYTTIDYDKRYLRILMDFDIRQNNINVDIIVEIKGFQKRQETKNVKINCTNKSILTVVKEFKHIILMEHRNYLADYNVLIYNPLFFQVRPIFKNLIEHIKNENIKQKKLRLKDELFYEYIMENDVLWYKVFTNLKFKTSIVQGRLCFPQSPISYIKRSNSRYICICINIDKVHYFFELNIKELGSENLIPHTIMIREHINEIDHQICIHLKELYKFIYVDKIVKRNISYFSVCTLNKIEFYHNIFKIKMDNDEIRFTQNYKEYIYSLQHEAIFTNSTSLEFQEFFRKTYYIKTLGECHNEVELLFRLLETGGRAEFFLKKILNKRGSAIYLILLHILLSDNLYKEFNLSKILRNKEFDETSKNLLIEKIITNLCNCSFLASTFLIKICLLYEVERFINENDVSDKPILLILSNIAALIKKKAGFIPCDNQYNVIKNIDLIEIFHVAVKFHLKDIQAYMNNIWKQIFSITSLYTGYEQNLCILEYVHFYIEKDRVFDFFCLNNITVENNNEIIRKKLSENTRNQRINEALYRYRKELKNIVYSFYEKRLSTALCKIKHDALNKKINYLYDKNKTKMFEKRLRQNGVNVIEKIFSNKCLTEDVSNVSAGINAELLYECKKDELEIFSRDLNKLINLNIRNTIKNDFLISLESLLDNEISNKKIFKEFAEKKIKKIRMLLCENELSEILNDYNIGVKFHRNLTKILENYDKK